MTANQQPAAVILGMSATGLYAIRELARAGVEVFGVDEQDQAGAYSKYLKAKFIHGDSKQRLNWLRDQFTSKPGTILIPCADQHVDFIIENRAELAEIFIWQSSISNGIAKSIMDKDSFYRICAQNGISFPKLWETVKSDLADLRNEITFPCFIKPARIQDLKGNMKGHKGWLPENREAFEHIIDEIPDNAGKLLVQEIVGGAESRITLWCGYLDQQGQVHQSFTARKLRQFPPGFGSASLVQSSSEPETQKIAENLLRKIGYHGIAAAEFKRDPIDDQLKIIEINVRPSLWFSASTAAKKFVTLQAFEDLSGASKKCQNLSQINGIQWRYWTKDFYSRCFYRFAKNFVLPAPNINDAGPNTTRIWALFSWDDPKPALVDLVLLFRKAVKSIFG